MYGNERRVEQIRAATFGKEVREPIVKSINRKLKVAGEQMDGLEAEHGTRIATVSTEPISGRPNYYTIGFTRADHS